MKIALCLSGHTRNFRYAYRYIEKTFLSAKGVDVFISTYDTPGYWNPNKPIDSIGIPVTENELLELYKPVKLEIDKYSSELEAKFIEDSKIIKSPRMRWGRIPNIVGMFWKIWKCNMLKKEYEEEHNFTYDLVIRCRLDSITENFDLNMPVEDVIYLWKKENGLFSDFLFYGTSSAMDSVCSIYLFIKEIYDMSPESLFDAHDLLERSISFFNLKWKDTHIRTEVINTPKGYCQEQKVALCLYGQPRNLKEGYEYLSKFVLKPYNPDVFIHLWDTNEPYNVSPWRMIDRTKIYHKNEVIALYNPVSIVSEIQTIYKVPSESSGYLLMSEIGRKNSQNILSQVHSRQMVVNLLESYHKKYDIVISARFDNIITSLPFQINPEKIYFSDTHSDRPTVYNDNLMIANQENTIKIMGIEKNLNIFLYNNSTHLNMESLLSTSIEYHCLSDKCIKTSELQIGHL